MSVKNAERRATREDDMSSFQSREAWEGRYVAITMEAIDLKAAPPFDAAEKIASDQLG